MLLKSPQFDLKLVTTSAGKAEYRAKLVAKLLTAAGRTDVPVGLGAGGRQGAGGQQAWVEGYSLASYAGKVHQDGVQALIDTVHAQAAKRQAITIIAIGPLHTLGEALTRDAGLAAQAHFVGMHGSVRKGYNNDPKPAVEYNMTHVPGAQKVFAAPWQSAAITPLDTCGLVILRGPRFETLKTSPDALIQALLENYRLWAKKTSLAELTASSVLFDTVAVYLAYPGAKPLVELETLKIAVTDKGMTVIDPAGAPMGVATNWKDLEGYHDLLVRTLSAPAVSRN
jgi:inosine-uridine nucleoside N-ribohydrolase